MIAPLVLFLLARLSWTVHGQSTSARCNVSNFQWSFNTLSQSPCLVAAYLQNTCSSGFNVPSLDSLGVQSYREPSVISRCGCSSVVYSLMAACAGCQNGSWYSLFVWQGGCGGDTDPVGTEPIPGGTRVPGWAYLDPGDGIFNPRVAMGNESPESTPSIPSSTSSSSSSTTSSVPTTTPIPTPSTTIPASISTSTFTGSSAPTSTQITVTSSPASIANKSLWFNCGEQFIITPGLRDFLDIHCECCINEYLQI
ncbi:uncharacterized protein EI90DRAFT_2665094 [Cantharellus anzutake]|uniref:uncharacterized protein n=1 Tax=Cantharellus anzutake TaxID=1750568 RepID=UPI0019068EA2|nr:uncharacterized protein EI90DRAFT_2665094 [Cantharellus anzutake]KAF8337566.1 hypothetical protein EI90DRAFT_2665094 [Cantharellus anzutake]